VNNFQVEIWQQRTGRLQSQPFPKRPAHPLQTTALVNEAYLKLIDQKVGHWQNRAHFFGIAAQIMRRVLIDQARKHLGAQRGGGKTISLDEVPVVSDERAAELVALDDALTSLTKVDERKGRVVDLRYFGGLSVEETSELLGVSRDTITRDWRRAIGDARRLFGAASLAGTDYDHSRTLSGN
jgi:RNA polymerase sigma factor (TIGR02999 family)